MTTRKPIYLDANGTLTEMNLSDELPVGLLPELTDLAVPATTLLEGVWPGDIIQFDGNKWRNTPLSFGSPGAAGSVCFYCASPTVHQKSAENAFPVHSLSTTPITTGELDVSVVCPADSEVVLAAWRYDTALGITTLPSGIWSPFIYCSVDDASGITWNTRNIAEIIESGAVTLTTSGSGTTRTATATGGFFASSDAGTTWLETPKGLYKITAYTSDTQVTIAVPLAYANETVGFTGSRWKILFATYSIDINGITPTEMPMGWDSVQNNFSIAPTSTIGIIDQVSNANGVGNITVTMTYDGGEDVTQHTRLFSTIPTGGSTDNGGGPLTTTQTADLTSTHIASLTPATVHALNDTLIASLTSTQIGKLTTTQLQGLSATQMAGLPTTALAGLTSTQMAAITTTAAAGLQGVVATGPLTTTQMAGLTTTTVDALTTTVIAALITRHINLLTTTHISQITTTQIQGLTTTQMAAFTATQFAAITTTAVGALQGLTAAAGPLTTTQMAGLTSTAMAAMSTAGIYGLTTTQAAAFCDVLEPIFSARYDQDPFKHDVVPFNDVLKMNFNGLNGSTSFIDNRGHIFTASGSAQITTTDKKYGTGSLLLNGSSYISTLDTSDWTLGSGDFTIEMFVKFASVSGYPTIASQLVYSSPDSSWKLQGGISGDAVYFAYTTDGTTVINASATWAHVVNTWYHLAVCRSGNTIRVFADGVQIGTKDVTGVTIYDSSRNLVIGAQPDGAYKFNGKIDSFRFTKGYARYTANFVVPAP